MTTQEDWLFRAHTLREAANRLRNSAAQLVADANRFDGLAENASSMAIAAPRSDRATEQDGK